MKKLVTEPSTVVDNALATYRQIIDQPGTFGRAHSLFYSASRCNAEGRFSQALTEFDTALALGLDLADLHHNRSISLFNLGQHALALESVARAVKGADSNNAATILNTYGFMLQHLGRFAQARQSYRKALEHDSTHGMARLNLGIVCLTLGDWETGWDCYESRWAGAREASSGQYERPHSPLPVWVGQTPQPGDGLLVFAEQGLGDTLQFCRYLTLAAKKFTKVSFLCPPVLTRLLRHSLGPEIAVCSSIPPDHSPWHWQVPLMSLPRVFKTRLDTIPAPTAYLQADPVQATFWQHQLLAQAGQANPLKVGLVWAGASGLAMDAKRSICLQHITPLFDVPGVQWFSLQKKMAVDMLALNAVAASTMLDFTDKLSDFADTAALVSQLDLVITVDTAVAHLAGGMGKPVWLLNRFETEWRWLLDRTDSPWYPSMRIFRQAQPDDWNDVVDQVARALQVLQGCSRAA